MKTLDQLFDVCNNFINKRYEIQEFQSRLETLLITDELKGLIEKDINDAINDIERIRFCSFDSLFYKEGSEVAQTLLKKVEEIRKL